MAGIYNNWVITKKYAEIETDAMTSGNKLVFSRLITSSDVMPQTNLKSLTDSILGTVTVNQTVSISSVKIDSSTATVTGIVSSDTCTLDYDINTVLIVGSYKGVEFLAASTTAVNPWRMPAKNVNQIVEYTFRPQFTLTNLDTVSTEVDPASVATNERVTDEVANLQTQVNTAKADRQSIWTKLLDFVDLAGNQIITGTKSFSQPIIGSITGLAGNDSNIVHKTGDEAVSGIKTFSAKQMFSGGAKIANTTEYADNATRANSINNLTNLGQNIITVKADDTPAKWASLGTGFSFFNDATLPLNNQPNRYLKVENTVNNSEVVQTAIVRNNAKAAQYTRTGNVTVGWYGTFTLSTPTIALDATAKATNPDSPELAGAMPPEHGGTGRTDGKAANDADLVHKSGDETISGTKTFNNGIFGEYIHATKDIVTDTNLGGNGAYLNYVHSNGDVRADVNVYGGQVFMVGGQKNYGFVDMGYGITGFFSRMGNMVVFCLEGVTNGVVPQDLATGFVLPYGWRPMVAQHVLFDVLGVQGLRVFDINPDGNTRFYGAQISQGSYPRGSGFWFTQDAW
ncbi:MAG: hypothetical protein LBI13_11175 [Streptococcaceae bacterium]|jgi:hypothetical protein|nr:hypothetical protein [Streptococcaceae bacterium]